MVVLGSSYWRRLALLQLVLFAGAMFSSGAHRASARHGYCSDHGQLIHLHQAPPSDPGADPAHGGLEPDRHLQGPHSCASIEFLSQLSHLLRATPPSAEPGVRPVAGWTGSHQAHEPIAILSRAPRLPPPG